MNIKRAVSATLLAGGIAVKGTGVASSASAGPSIGKTWNAGTTLYYAYYAATDTFCIGRGSSSPRDSAWRSPRVAGGCTP